LEKALYDAYDSAPLVLIDILHLHSSETSKYLFLKLLAEITSLSAQSLRNILDIFANGTKKGVAIKNKLIAYIDPSHVNITFSANYFLRKPILNQVFIFRKK
jgi:hypothetical protein